MHFYSKKNIHKLEKYLGVKSEPSQQEIILWEKVSAYNTYFTKIPGILGIAICNSLSMNAAHKDSDIDLFIITKKNRLWTVRILMTLLLTLLGERKNKNNHTGKFCLSFFITQEGLSLKNIALENDIYLAYWIDNLKPIINRKNIFNRFREVNKEGLSIQSTYPGIPSPLKEREAAESQNFVASFSPKGERIQDGGDYEGIQGGGGKNSEHPLLKTSRLLTICGDGCEKLLKIIFLPRTKKSFQKLGKPFGVVISETMLKFHNKDKRKEIRDTIISS